MTIPTIFPKFATLVLIATFAVAPAAMAQNRAGYPLESSPYRDLESPQLITLYTGYYSASKDPLGAAPGSAPLIGLRYEVTVAGPAQFFVRAARVSSKRTSYNPTLAQPSRRVGEVSIPMYLADLGFSFNLTGRKSWHSIVPIAGFSLGVATANAKAPDDPYSFGTVFQGSTELGIRFVPGGAFEGRVTIGNTLYQTKYPGEYYVNGSDGTPLLITSQTSRTSYRNNWMFTAGASVAIFR